MKENRINKAIVAATVISFLMVLLFVLLGLAQQKGMLPFDFSVQAATEAGIQTFHLKEISEEAWKRAVKGLPSIKSVTLTTTIYSPLTRNIFIYVNPGEGSAVQANGKPIQLLKNRFFTPFPVSKGFNYLRIHYNKPISELRVIFTESRVKVKWPFPFYQVVRPGGRFSAARILCLFTFFIDRFKSVGFLIAFLFLLFRMGLLLIKKEGISTLPQPSVFFWVFNILANLAIMQVLSAFLFQQCQLKPSFIPLTATALLLSAVTLGLDHRKISFSNRFPWKHFFILFCICLLISAYVFFAGGQILPLGPIGFGDMDAHLQMIKTIQKVGNFQLEENRGIYPQGLHAGIANLAMLTKTEPEEILTLLEMAILIVFSFAVYLLGVSLFPKIPPVSWLLAIALSHWQFFTETLFIRYSFPAVASTAMFFLSLYFLRKGSAATSASLLAAGLAAYPYFAIPFLLGVIFFELGLNRKLDFHWVLALIPKLIPASVVMGLYAWNYSKFGFAQQKEGFNYSSPWNPFLSLGVWNTVLVFAGLLVILSRKQTKPFLGLIFGTACGFLSYYVLYALNSNSSAYYIMKNANYLIPLGVIAVAVLMDQILRRWRGNIIFTILIMIIVVAISAFTLYQSKKTGLAHPPQGITMVNRWLIRHTDPQEKIIFISDNKELPFFIRLTLGYHRALIFICRESQIDSSQGNWLVSENRFLKAFLKTSAWRKIHQYRDLSVFHRIHAD